MSPTNRVKACPNCGSPDVIGLVSSDVECQTCGMTSMGHLRSLPEVAERRKATYLAAQNCPVCDNTGLAYDAIEQREVPCGGLGCVVGK